MDGRTEGRARKDGNGEPRNFELLRYFSLTSLVTIAVVAALLAMIHRQVATDSMARTIERANGSTARALKGALWPTLRPILTAVEVGGTVERLTALPAFATATAAARDLIRDTPIAKIKVFHHSGVVVFSTDDRDVGSSHADNPRFQRAMRGEVVNMIHRNATIRRFEDIISGRDLVATYLPDDSKGQMGPIAIFELYSDVTPALADVGRTEKTLVAGVTAALVVLWGLLFLIVRHGDGILRRYEDDLRQANDRLEVTVAERTMALTAEITEREATQQELLASRERFQDFADVASDWMWETDDALRLVYVSGRVQSVLGQAPLSLDGLPVEALLIHAEDRPLVAAMRADMTDHRPLEAREFAILRPEDSGREGRQVVRVNAKPVFDDTGAFQGYRGTGVTITELVEAVTARTLAERALGESEARFRTLIEHSNQGVLVHRHFRPMYANQALASILGYDKPGDILAMETVDAVFAPHEREKIRRFHEARLSGRPAPSDYEFQAQRRDGSLVWLDNRSFGIEFGDGPAVCTTVFDVTDRKRLDDALRASMEQANLANRAKSEFLANMGHELRTPLNAIIGFSSAMLSGIFGPLKPDPYRDYTRSIHDSGTHLLEIINDILDVSTLEMGRLRLIEEEVDLGAVLEASFRLIRSRAEARDITLIAAVDGSPPRLKADERRVKQVLVNLLSNAVKFSHDGGQVHADIATAADGGVEIRVSDQGIGMAPEDVPRALAPFEQVDGSLSRSYDGTGLGLSVTKGLMEAHGGTIQIQSQVNEGTTVIVTFPAHRILVRP